MHRPSPTLRSWLSEEPFSLALSSGFFGFYAHCGVLLVLEDEGLRPTQICGSSAGALTGGLWAAGVDAATLSSELLNLRREDFWDPAPGLGVLRGRLFQKRLASLLPVREIRDCPVSLAISVFDILTRRTRVLREGPLHRAIHASCAVPVLFHPVMINSRPTWDGGVADRPGLAGASPSARVLYHHLGNRSPWRRPGSPALRVPERANMITLTVDHLPRVHPFSLSRGAEALRLARQAMEAALDMPAEQSLIRMTDPA